MRTINKKIYNRLKALEKTNRIKVFSFNNNERMPKGSVGFPDFVILGYNGYVLFLEAKYGNDRLSEKQKDLYEFCKKAGINYRIIKEDLIDDVINEVLKQTEDKVGVVEGLLKKCQSTRQIYENKQ